MSASTPKLGLYQPGGGETGLITPDEVADIDKLNDNFDKIDRATGVAVVTSSTRPGTPFAGQQIYETNTRLSYVWSGSAWTLITPPVTIFVQSGTPTANAVNDLWFF
jgi:hypothetical protein